MITIYEPKGRRREYGRIGLHLYSGCSHGCLYCYAPGCLHRHRDIFLECGAEGEASRRWSASPQVRRKREEGLAVIHQGPYQPAGEQEGLTLQALDILTDHRVNFQVLTKGGPGPCRTSSR